MNFQKISEMFKKVEESSKIIKKAPENSENYHKILEKKAQLRKF
jgi:hypothetical protein